MRHEFNSDRPKHKIIAGDIPINAARYPIQELLEAFRGALSHRNDLRLILAGRRCAENGFSVWNYLDEHGITDSVDFLPYFDRCVDFPVKKSECDVWIPRHTSPSDITPSGLLTSIERPNLSRSMTALFVTSFHTEKLEGNSFLMRQWLEYLQLAGYRTHVVYYGIDKAIVRTEDRRRSLSKYDIYLEVDVSTRIVGTNRNGLNVHVDDWCGSELLEKISSLCEAFEYDIAIVNYAFTSAVFDRVASYTRKILLTHDSFAGRNRRLLAQGYPEASWVSLDERGERQAFHRADVVVALQDNEADGFRALATAPTQVRVISPIPPVQQPIRSVEQEGRLRVGFFGSGNYVNDHNLIEYLNAWVAIPSLLENAELILAGGICASLRHYAPADLLAKVAPRLLGPVESLQEFFEACDVFINPERGGTGIKIKTLESMSYGAAVLTTAAGAIGIDSRSRFHNASGVAALASLTAEVAEERSLLTAIRLETAETYESYVRRHRSAMEGLLGPIRAAPGPVPSCPSDHRSWRRRGGVPDLVVPRYVERSAAPYQLDEFRKFFARVEIRGKRVLEIGSDFHLAIARLFAANGASRVIATNIGSWRSPEPMPANVTFMVGDVADIDLPECSFDIIFGIAILEHIPDPGRVALAIKRLLRPSGIAYLQGWPMWTGSLGHHVWVNAGQIAELDKAPLPEGYAPTDPIYSFAESARNPIPNWAHLGRGPDELVDLLAEREIPRAHAEGIARYVYDVDHQMAGSCSNFRAPSEIIAAFDVHLAVEAEPMVSAEEANEHFEAALAHYSETDLRTLGLQLWLAVDPDNLPTRAVETEPGVSVIIPFHNVQDYIGECLTSVLAQEYRDFEIIFVDDASEDSSRAIVERAVAADRRVRIITHDRNRGLGQARNTGVKHARGDYILFLDSDDLLSGPAALGTMVAAARRTGRRLVVGSCERLRPDGSLAEFDRGRGGRPGEVIAGIDAFRGGVGLPDAPYLPMRAWGMLIERTFYNELGLDFPPGEHEDMAHTPILYFCAGGVLYERTVVVHYRERSGAISASPWSAAKIGRYINLWTTMKARMLRHGLEEQLGDVAVMFAWHLIWRTGENGIETGVTDSLIAAVRSILGDLRGACSTTMLHMLLDGVRRFLMAGDGGAATYHALAAAIPEPLVLEYHRSKLGIDPIDKVAPKQLASVDGSLSTCGPGKIRWIDRADNEARMGAIFADYEAFASERLKTLPAMLTYGDRALYFSAARNFSFEGSIVDGGCFVGGTTTCLVEGLRHNPALADRSRDTRGLIRVYDMFEIDDDYILRHLRESYPGQTFTPRGSFLPVFRDNLKADAELLDIRAGDVTSIGYTDNARIEIFGVDFCKALAVTDFAVRDFFPRLMRGAVVLQQDFIHEFHPHIHLSMMRLSDYFETYLELKGGGTVAFVCRQEISPELVRERFGSDSSWFWEIERNASLLRGLAEHSLYDENRFVLLLTLAMYFLSTGQTNEARAIYREARKRYPGCEPSELTCRMMEG